MSLDDLRALNDRLSLTLQSGNQLAFDWVIGDDRLQFTSGIPRTFQNVPLAHVQDSATFAELLHPDDRRTLRTPLIHALKQTLAYGAIQHLELRLEDALLGWRWVDLSGMVIERDGAGRALRAVGMFTDISGRKLAEQRAAKMHNLYATLRRTNHAILRMQTPERLFQEICRIAIEHGKFELATIRLLDPATQLLNIAASFGQHAALFETVEVSADPDKPTGHGPSGIAIRENRPNICNDFFSSDYPAQWKSLAAKLGWHAFASFPFSRAQRPIGVLILYSAEKNFFDQSLIDLLKEMTQEISFALDNFDHEVQRASMEVALADSEARYRQMIELSPEAIFIELDGRFALVNDACVKLFGVMHAGELIDQEVSPFLHPDYRGNDQTRPYQWPAEAATPAHFSDELWLRKDGTPFHAEVATAKLMYLGEPATQVIIRDITARKLAEQIQLAQNRILNMIASDAALGDILHAICQFVEDQSPRSLCSIQTLNPEGTALRAGVAPNVARSYLEAIAEMAIGSCNCSFGTAVFRREPVITTCIATDALWMPWCANALQHGLHACASWPIFGKSNKVLGTVSLYYREPGAPNAEELQLVNISTRLAGIAIENKDAEDRIRYLAHHDEMTSLPNRALFNQMLNHALSGAQRRDQRLAVLFIDLDRFKNINDTLGHDAGDTALREFTRRMQSSLRKNDFLARMGGDEFYVLIEDLTDGQYAATVAQKILHEATAPFFIEGQECHLTASIGIAIYPDDGGDAQSLLKNADIAMYRAKGDGRNAYHFYSASNNIHTIERLVMESQLRRAIENDEFVLHYQPKVEIATGRVTGVEALVRWRHPERGLLPPGYFIPLAEETRLIIPLSKKILRIACQDALIINATATHPVAVAVNLSARQLDDPGFLDGIRSLLDATGISPHLLTLEITESMVMHNPEHAVHIMNELLAIGIHLDIDDFGTGYSSLANLKRFPVLSLKIDRSFIQDIPADPNDTAITKAIIAMGHSMGLRIIAEGVESRVQIDALRRFGCDELQGFYFSRPIPIEEFLAWQKHPLPDIGLPTDCRTNA